MEKYKIIESNNFNRKNHFHYFQNTGTIIQFTKKIEVMNLVLKCKKDKISFQAYMLYILYKVLNTIANFKYDILDGNLIEWDTIVPTFSSINEKTKIFFTLYSPMKDNYLDFEKEYKKVINAYSDSEDLVPQESLPSNVFNVSCIPWLHYDHFSSNFKTAENQIVKMITIGKYEEIDKKYILPITIQVSHSIVDGYHISLFFEKLQLETKTTLSLFNSIMNGDFYILINAITLA